MRNNDTEEEQKKASGNVLRHLLKQKWQALLPAVPYLGPSTARRSSPVNFFYADGTHSSIARRKGRVFLTILNFE